MSADLRDTLPVSTFRQQMARLGISVPDELPATIERESRLVRSFGLTIAQTNYVFKKG